MEKFNLELENTHLIELSNSDLVNIDGGRRKIWVALGYALSWITDMSPEAAEA
nr:hypothetical protein [uncultured Carboxylicivirga sp.]